MRASTIVKSSSIVEYNWRTIESPQFDLKIRNGESGEVFPRILNCNCSYSLEINVLHTFHVKLLLHDNYHYMGASDELIQMTSGIYDKEL